MEALKAKDEGNKAHSSGDYPAALAAYTKAIELYPIDDSHKAIFFGNRAATHMALVRACPLRTASAHFTQNHYEDVVSDATQSLAVDRA